MLHFSVLCSVMFSLCQSIYAAGPACFNYETYEHQGAAVAGANRALVSYPHQLNAARSAAIPILVPGVYQLGISKGRFLGAAPTLWQHALFNLGGGVLAFQEACLMTLERQNIGIIVNFQHPGEINAIAAGFPVPAVAAAFGWAAPALLMQYLNRSLGRGGYSSPLATTLFRLRHGIPPNFIGLVGGGAADTVLIHIHQQMRVSKNVKELSYNSIPNIPGYVSIKDIIDNQFILFGVGVPDSATVLSADFLQSE